VKRAIACYILLFMSLAAQTLAQESESPLTAQEILKQMANRYASCQSYRDSGEVIQVKSDATGKKTQETRFTTAFRRPGRFRFEYQYRFPRYGLYRYIVWADGEDFRSYCDSTLRSRSTRPWSSPRQGPSASPR
jgi:outer membrane lipoprotein-sorting protein